MENNINAYELNSQIDPVALLGHIGYHKSKPKISNGEIRDYCPIHGGDKQQSLAISQENHTYFCHSCSAKGDLIDLYCKAKKIAFKDAIDELASIFHVYSSRSQEKYNYTQPKPDSKVSAKQTITLEQTWDKGIEEGTHPYLDKKKIPGCPGIKFGKDQKGNHSIMVPYSKFDSMQVLRMQTIQFVNEKGKYFLEGFQAAGSFFMIGAIKKGGTVYVAEGLATCITIWLALGEKHPVISCGSAGNIPAVVANLREYDPSVKIVLVLDNSNAAFKAMAKIPFPFNYCVPSFEGLHYPEGSDPDDMNDLISVCGQTLEEVSRQLKNLKSNEQDDFFTRLGNLIGDHKYSLRLKDRTYEKFEVEHKSLLSGGGLITGYERLDEQLYFSEGDFVTIQAMSNHGKSTFMLHLAYRFLTNAENDRKDPVSIFITYESTPLRVEEKLLNIISKEIEGEIILQYNRKQKEKYLYPNKGDFGSTILFYNQLHSQRKFDILKRVSLESLESLIDLYKEEHPNRTLIFFLDYLQIIENSLESDGWERIKEIAYKLEALAIDKSVIIFSACQVNDKRQAREGRDIYNASTTNIDLINHSHTSLRANKDLEKLYKEKVDGKDLCTLSVYKQKHGSSFILEEYLLFDGHNFYENNLVSINQTSINPNGPQSTGVGNEFDFIKDM